MVMKKLIVYNGIRTELLNSSSLVIFYQLLLIMHHSLISRNVCSGQRKLQ